MVKTDQKTTAPIVNQRNFLRELIEVSSLAYLNNNFRPAKIFELQQWPIYVIKSMRILNYPIILSHRRNRNLPLLFYLLFVYLFTCFVRIHAHSSVGPFTKFACLMLCSSVSTVSQFNFQIFFFLISYPKACIPVSTTNRHARRISVDNRPNLKQIIRMTSVPSNIILHILHEVEFLIVQQL